MYRPSEGGRLSRPRHCTAVSVQPVPKAAYRSDFRENTETFCPQRDSILGPIAPQASVLPLDHCDLQSHSWWSVCPSNLSINLWTPGQFHCFWTCQLELSTFISSRSILVTWTIPPSTEDISVSSGLRARAIADHLNRYDARVAKFRNELDLTAGFNNGRKTLLRKSPKSIETWQQHYWTGKCEDE